MKKQQQRQLFIIVFVAVAVLAVFSAVTPLSIIQVTAASGYWQDIQNAVNQVVAQGGIGDVYVPAGTWNFVNVGEAWSGVEAGRVNVPAGVNIYGAANNRDGNGQNTEWRTVLRLPWDVPGGQGNNGISWFKFTGTEVVGKSSRFSDLKLVGYRSVDSNSWQFQCPVRVAGIRDFRIDHCYFEHTTLGVQVWGVHTGGVIDHCYLVNPVYTVGWNMGDCSVQYGVVTGRGYPTFSNPYDPYWDSNTQNVLGKANDYTVFIEDCYFSGWRHCIASNNGGHQVLRYSTIENDAGYGSIDAHGWGVVGDDGLMDLVGTRATEVYNCHITGSTGYGAAATIRGGAGVAFGNTVGGGTYHWFLMFSQESSADLCKTRDWYVWDNTMLSGCIETYGLTAGVDYFLYKPSWYTPYVYPHPLVSGEAYTPPEPTPTPLPPDLPTISVRISATDGGFTIPEARVYSYQYVVGTSNEISAVPSEGYYFVEWKFENGTVASSSDTFTFVAKEGFEVTAMFEEGISPSPTPSPNGGGESSENNYIPVISDIIDFLGHLWSWIWTGVW